MCGGWNPPIKSRQGDAEVDGYVARGDAAGDQLLRRLDLAIGHLPLSSAFASKLAGYFEACASSLDARSISARLAALHSPGLSAILESPTYWSNP